MLITFEGIDGCGKSTQIERLVEWFETRGEQAVVLREPGGTELSEKIRSLLLDSDLEMHPVTELLLFSAARSQLITEKVIPQLEQGRVVILDRFYDSTSAYQGYGRRSADPEQIAMLNRLAAHELEPDLTLYLRISPELAAERTANQRKDRMERAGDAFFQRVADGFDRLAANSERIQTIDASQDVQAVHRQVTAVVTTFISER